MIKRIDLSHLITGKQACFGGAWYHKVMSVDYDFRGIEGVITLPMPLIKRFKEDKEPTDLIDMDLSNLDVSSIYLGGHAKHESDVGLAFSRAIINDKVTHGGCVFRPFWRYITDLTSDEGDYDLSNGRNYKASVLNNQNGLKNVYAMYHPSFSEYYYLPGDKLKVSLTSPKENYLILKIEVIEISNHPYSIKFRKDNNLKAPQDFTSPLISSPGHGTSMPKTYKRVNAIDQVANEGKAAIITNSIIQDAIWENCYLIYQEDGEFYKTPLNEKTSVQMSCPDKKAFLINKIDDNGGQNITIKPNELLK